MEEKEAIKEQIEKLDQRPEEWIELTKESFNFVSYACHTLLTRMC